MEQHLSPPLRQWADHMQRLQWAALILDADWNLRWVSPPLRQFLGADPETDLGFGSHLAQAWMRDEWNRAVTSESQVELFADVAPFLVRAIADAGHEPNDVLEEPFASLARQVEPASSIPSVWSSSFEYRDPQSPELPTYRVNVCALLLNDAEGSLDGLILIFFMGMNPNLMSLLARGDQAMHERMAGLIEPAPHEAAVLFCDLHESGRLSRELSSVTYFKLIRRLWTGIDAAIAGEGGIVGKHAGDGASAFFLSEHLGSASEAVAAAVRAARSIHGTSEKVFREMVDGNCLMRVGLHWGGGLYMGQLIPGSRLDVTALGDAVNEAARVQESAPPGATLVTKQLVERLDPNGADALRIDRDGMRFTLLADLPGVPEKARRDAGSLPVSAIE